MGGGWLRAMGSPRRAGSTPEPAHSLLSIATSIIPDARTDACNRKRGGGDLGAAVHVFILHFPPVRHSPSNFLLLLHMILLIV